MQHQALLLAHSLIVGSRSLIVGSASKPGDDCGGRLPQSWADDTVDDATPKRYGADDWEEEQADRDSRLQRF